MDDGNWVLRWWRGRARTSTARRKQKAKQAQEANTVQEFPSHGKAHTIPIAFFYGRNDLPTLGAILRLSLATSRNYFDNPLPRRSRSLGNLRFYRPLSQACLYQQPLRCFGERTLLREHAGQFQVLDCSRYRRLRQDQRKWTLAPSRLGGHKIGHSDNQADSNEVGKTQLTQ